MNDPRFNWIFEVCSYTGHTGHKPAEVVVAQSKTAGVHFSCREPSSSQRCGVPVDALCSWMAVTQCAAVSFTMPHYTLLISVCVTNKNKFNWIKCHSLIYETYIILITDLTHLFWHSKACLLDMEKLGPFQNSWMNYANIVISYIRHQKLSLNGKYIVLFLIEAWSSNWT